MSSTNRGAIRQQYDTYYTPENVIHNFLDNYTLPNRKDINILDPSAGKGSFGKVIREKEYENNLTAMEIRKEEEKLLQEHHDNVIIDNFINAEVNDKYNIVIGNPPFSYALDFVKKSFDIVSSDGIIIFLLRTAFLESKSRYDFWQKHPLSKLYVLSKRPSFDNKGTDSCSYSFFIWEMGSNKQEIRVI